MKLLDILFEYVVDLNEKLKPITQQDFINRSQQIHKDDNGNSIYDYSEVNFDDSDYVNQLSKVKINCPKHGTFFQSPKDHLRGSGCPECGKKKIGIKLINTLDNFIERSKRTHIDKNGNPLYDYSKTIYKGANIPVKIDCPIHGEFTIRPSDHYKGRGCQKCGYERTGKKLVSSKEDFIRKAQIKHKDKNDNPLYTYDEVDYKTAHDKVIITCPIHGEFLQTPNNHLDGKGCPECNESKGEKELKKYLTKNGYNYITEKTFEDCTNIHKQKRCQRYKFDFYLPNENVLIEFDGIQHFKEHPYFHKTNEIFNENIKDDLLKNMYCEKKDIKLIRISYLDIKNIDQEIENGLKSFKRLHLSTKYPKAGWNS